MGTVVALAGQIGGAKLAHGLARLRGRNLAVIVNTGDDGEVLGLSVSPDVDTMLYTLSGIANPSRGWEPVDETYSLHDMVKHLGWSLRSPIGDRSLANGLLEYKHRAGTERAEVPATGILAFLQERISADDQPSRSQRAASSAK